MLTLSPSRCAFLWYSYCLLLYTCHAFYLHKGVLPAARTVCYKTSTEYLSFDSSEDYKMRQSLSSQNEQRQRPLPTMPSQLFQQLAMSQLELLANSLSGKSGTGKIKSMALYLPQENAKTGQLEFLPAILYPHPDSDRVFIANDANSGLPPALPRTLSSLPGFAHATSLLPAYPMVSTVSDDGTTTENVGVGVVEEVLCDIKTGGTALSVPLFSGSQTVGVLLVSPNVRAKSRREKQNGANTTDNISSGSTWTKADRQQVARAAQSLSLALAMDSERSMMAEQQKAAAKDLSDSLHQLKNPIQALRTYTKLLQQRIASSDSSANTPMLLELTDDLIAQGDRLVERVKPFDSILNGMEKRKFLLAPNLSTSSDNANNSLTKWQPPMLSQEEILYTTRPADLRDMSILDSNGKQVDSDVDHLLQPSVSGSAVYKNNVPTQSSLLRSLDLEMSFLDDVLEPVVSTFQAIASDCNVKFDVEMSDEIPGVRIQAEGLQEALTNVIDNAIKYTKDYSTGRPRVRIRTMPNERPLPPGVTILIEDNGPGIAKNEETMIFERGFRSTSTSSTTGSGIGLDIAKSLIQAMGGSIKIVNSSTYPNSLGGTVVEIILYRSPDLHS